MEDTSEVPGREERLCESEASGHSGGQLKGEAEESVEGLPVIKEENEVPSSQDDDPTPASELEVSVERLLQRQRSEIMFELRRLQYGDRPVTGQEQRRRAVENLVLRALGPTVSHPPVRAGTTTTQTLNASSTSETHRPEEILVEVNALVERRPVSSILQSLSFRRSLENSVRGALLSMRRNQPGSGVAASTRVVNPVENRETPALSRAELDVDRRSPSSISLQSSGGSATEAGEDAANATPAPIPTPVTGNGNGTARAEEWIQRHVPLPANQIDANEMRTRDILHQMQHEEFVVEISDLIHRQLVTSALSGNFRDVLERRLRMHVENSGIDGSRVQEQLRQLPRSTVHLRNDFFDLGIMPPPLAAAAEAGDAVDNMSVISATAAVALPQAYTQSNAAMNREIQSLRTELQELKNMMRLSFDLQLDIQRSIRQEISAALAAQTSGAANVPSSSSSRAHASGHPATPGSACLICLDKQVDTALYKCGHLCLCHACAIQLRANGSNCPVCRAPIRDIMRTYRP